MASLLLAVASAAGALAATVPATGECVSPPCLSKVGGLYMGGGAAEITAYNAKTKTLFVINNHEDKGAIAAVSLSEPTKPTEIGEFTYANAESTPVDEQLGLANSVAECNGLVAVAVEHATKQNSGWVYIYNAEALSGDLKKNPSAVRPTPVGKYRTGALPDMVTFTKTCEYVLTANEGEPNDEYTVDPEGSVTIIDIRKGADKGVVKTADFKHFNNKLASLRPQGVRVYGKIQKDGKFLRDSTAAEDFEPEYITCEEPAKGFACYVTLQENNAIARIDVAKARVTDVWGLGLKDWGKHSIDTSDKDGAITMKKRPGLKTAYCPDSIAAVQSKGRTFLVYANEGDSRDYKGFSEEVRGGDIANFTIGAAKTLAGALGDEKDLGRIKLTNTVADATGNYSEILGFGGRSFSVFDTKNKKMAFDSGNQFEKTIAKNEKKNFNANSGEFKAEDLFDSRSDDKGPEPEGLTIGEVAGRHYAFIGLERQGGLMVYDVTNPVKPTYKQFVNSDNFARDEKAKSYQGNDVGPEGVLFISAKDSPSGKPLVVAAYEMSGTIAVFQFA